MRKMKVILACSRSHLEHLIKKGSQIWFSLCLPSVLNSTDKFTCLSFALFLGFSIRCSWLRSGTVSNRQMMRTWTAPQPCAHGSHWLCLFYERKQGQHVWFNNGTSSFRGLHQNAFSMCVVHTSPYLTSTLPGTIPDITRSGFVLVKECEWNHKIISLEGHEVCHTAYPCGPSTFYLLG